MQVTVNGEAMELYPGTSLAVMLEQLNIKAGAIVVELDREIINKEHYSQVELKPGSVVEIVQFMGGG